MGTNYYAKRNTCPHCKRCDEVDELHIGKSSGGWVFTLHVIPEEGLTNLSDWLILLEREGVIITNEYGESIAPKEMHRIIVEREWPRLQFPYTDNQFGRTPGRVYQSAQEMGEAQGYVAGPNGLWRHKIDKFCIGHGEGTWDYVTGEFC
jgi:hypothetical protein